MPFIDVTMIEGRTPQQKDAFIKALTEAAITTLGTPREAVRVVLREVPGEHWAVGGVPKKPLVPG